MDLVLVVILDAKHEAEVASLLFTVLPQKVNQIIKHCWVECLDILYDEDNGLECVHTWLVIKQAGDAFESLLAE